MQDHNVKQLGRISMYAKCIGGCMQGDSEGSNPRLGETKIKSRFLGRTHVKLVRAGEFYFYLFFHVCT